MEYINKDLGSYHLHMIKTDKFKTIKVKVAFRRPIVKSEITIRNILANILVQTTNKYKTRRALAIKAQDLYAASVSSKNDRIGNYINTEIMLSILNDKYTEEGNFKQGLDFLYDLIYDPNIKDNGFDDEQLQIILKSAKTSLESLKEDSNYYSLIRLFEVMDSDRPSSYRLAGYLEDIEKIDAKNLYKYYLELLHKDLMDIIFIGDIDFLEVEELIRNKFKQKTFKKSRSPYYLDEVKPRVRKRTVIEKDNNNQSKLAIGLRLTGISKYEKNYPLTLYNIILGGGDDSKLFRNVREKNSLCYYINSVPQKLDNILIIRAGIDKKNIKKTVTLVEKELNNIKKGKVSEADLKTAKEYFATAIDSLLESQTGIMDHYYMMSLLKTDDIETRLKKMNEVTLADIIKVSKKVKIDTVYCLEGINNEEN